MRIYFAHPISHYNTAFETYCIQSIKFAYPNAEVVNPNGEVHQKACTEFRLGMPYFLLLAQTCDEVVYVPFHDGEVGAGVYAELVEMGRAGKAIHRIVPVDGDYGKLYSVDYKEIRPLSINETKKRVRAGAL